VSRDEIIRELDRVTTRLDTLAVNRIDQRVIDTVHATACRIVESTNDPQRPQDAELPRVGPIALAAQLTIVVRDYLATTTAASRDAAVAEMLTDLRRSLP
jgi:hypothetical protein